jgi:hypothetical protein
LRQLRTCSRSRIVPCRVVTDRRAMLAAQRGPLHVGQIRVWVASSRVRSAGARALRRGMGRLLEAILAQGVTTSPPPINPTLPP